MTAWALPWRAEVAVELVLWVMATPAYCVVVSFWMKLWAEPELDFELALWFAVYID